MAQTDIQTAKGTAIKVIHIYQFDALQATDFSLHLGETPRSSLHARAHTHRHTHSRPNPTPLTTFHIHNDFRQTSTGYRLDYTSIALGHVHHFSWPKHAQSPSPLFRGPSAVATCHARFLGRGLCGAPHEERLQTCADAGLRAQAQPERRPILVPLMSATVAHAHRAYTAQPKAKTLIGAQRGHGSFTREGQEILPFASSPSASPNFPSPRNIPPRDPKLPFIMLLGARLPGSDLSPIHLDLPAPTRSPACTGGTRHGWTRQAIRRCTVVTSNEKGEGRGLVDGSATPCTHGKATKHQLMIDLPMGKFSPTRGFDARRRSPAPLSHGFMSR